MRKTVMIMPIETSRWFKRSISGFLEERKQYLLETLEISNIENTTPVDQITPDLSSFTGCINLYKSHKASWFTYSVLERDNFICIKMDIWLPSHLVAPHLILEVLIVKNTCYFYFDYVSRLDLCANPEHLKRFYTGKPNEFYLTTCSNPELEEVKPVCPYFRQLVSANALTFSCELDLYTTSLVKRLAETHIDRWVKWLKNPQMVEPSLIETIATRDRRLREIIPSITLAARDLNTLIGKEATALLTSQWSGVLED